MIDIGYKLLCLKLSSIGMIPGLPIILLVRQFFGRWFKSPFRKVGIRIRGL